MSDDLDLPALRAKSEAAHAGPWFCESVEQNGGIIDAIHEPDIARSIWLHDAEFIAAANPSVVAALIDENERLRQSVEDSRWWANAQTTRANDANERANVAEARAEQAEAALARADRAVAPSELFDALYEALYGAVRVSGEEREIVAQLAEAVSLAVRAAAKDGE